MLRVGVAGLGRWGRVLIDSIQGKSDKVTCVAAVTGRKERAVDYCAEKGIELLDDYSELLTHPDVDAIVLATPHTQHVDQIVAAAEAGKPVFCDKPLTLNEADARRAADACKAAGLPLCVGFNRRFLPAMIKMKELATSGALGKILHIEGNISGNGALRYSGDHWRASETESPAGGMTAMGVHMMDAMMSVCGPVASLRAVSEKHGTDGAVDDTTFATVHFTSGVTGVLTTMFATHLLWRIQVFGTKGWAEVRDQERIEVRLLEGDNSAEEFPGFDMERAELEAFADTVASGAEFPVPLEDAIHGIAILEAIVKASKTDTEVKLG
ncbi:MAG: Gfo/Idh/MocA family oxidoreductase [Rhodospirillales bacterium]|nr:Gfo/Idh/MocA family oxidoreductase [Rhodospirillales bacterium]MBO6785359.1 Gfo/Idh/MocA family oxidoreductase [Rhodospirillales bacterium]